MLSVNDKTALMLLKTAFDRGDADLGQNHKLMYLHTPETPPDLGKQEELVSIYVIVLISDPFSKLHINSTSHPS